LGGEEKSPKMMRAPPVGWRDEPLGLDIIPLSTARLQP
jgi:hypothetical protein